MSGFRVDVFDADGVPLGKTSINISNVEISKRISRIGQCRFSLPAVVFDEQGFGFGRRYKLYSGRDGYLGEFKHDAEETDAETQLTTITANDELWKLNDICVGFNWSFSETSLPYSSGVVHQLVSLAGMNEVFATSFGDLGTFNRDFQGETALVALDIVRQSQRGWFALNNPGEVVYGRFTSTDDYLSDVALRNTASVNDVAEAQTNYAIISKLRRTGSSANVVNRLIPRGAGLGETQLDLRYSNRTTPYTIGSLGNRDGGNTDGAHDSLAKTRRYYIQDTSSIATYGLVERVISFSDIRPLTNSLADRKNAANALYDLAAAYMAQFKQPTVTYEVECVNLPKNIRPGMVCQVDYRGVMETESGRKSYLRVNNQKFFITEVTRQYDESGSSFCTLAISNNGERISDSIDVLTTTLKDVDKLKLRVQPSMTYYSRNGGERPVKNTLPYDFLFKLGPEVMELNELICVFRMLPLRSYATQVGAGGGSTQSSASGGGSTATSGSSGSAHTHTIKVRGNNSGPYRVLYIDDGLNFCTPGYGSDVNASTLEASTDHTHTVSIPSHTHAVTTPDHTHPTSFGITEDTNTLVSVRTYLDGTEIASAFNITLGSSTPYPVSGGGWFSVDILPSLLAQSDWHGNHDLQFTCSSGQGTIFAEIQGRVTIQPIKL